MVIIPQFEIVIFAEFINLLPITRRAFFSFINLEHGPKRIGGVTLIVPEIFNIGTWSPESISEMFPNPKVIAPKYPPQ